MPTLEGDGSKLVLAGSARRQPKAYSVLDAGDTTVRIAAGSLHRITRGSIYSIRKQDLVRGSSENLADAVIESVGVTESVARIVTGSNRGVRTPDLNGMSAILKTYAPSDQSLLVRFEGVANAEEVIAGLDFARATGDSNAWHVAVSKPSAGFSVRRADGSRIGDVATVGALRRSLQNEWMHRFLNGLENPSGDALKFKVRLVPVNVQDGGSAVLSDRKEEFTQGVLTLADGDHFRIEVENLGSTDIYVTVFLIDANGEIKPIHPLPRMHSSIRGWPEEIRRQVRFNRVRSKLDGHPIASFPSLNSQKLGLSFSSGSTPGNSISVLKVIATDVECDLGSAFDELSRGDDAAARSLPPSVQPLATLLDKARRGEATRGEVSLVPSHWGVIEVPVLIKTS
jgi:hypothetical protein